MAAGVRCRTGGRGVHVCGLRVPHAVFGKGLGARCLGATSTYKVGCGTGSPVLARGERPWGSTSVGVSEHLSAGRASAAVRGTTFPLRRVGEGRRHPPRQRAEASPAAAGVSHAGAGGAGAALPAG